MELAEWKLIIDKGRNAIQTDESLFVQFQKLYRENFGQDACVTCPGGFESGWDLFESTYLKRLASNAKTGAKTIAFKFKKNHLIWSAKSFTHYGPANTDDATAIVLLRESKSNIVHFESYPTNWEQLVDGVTETPAVVVNLDANADASTDKSTETTDVVSESAIESTDETKEVVEPVVENEQHTVVPIEETSTPLVVESEKTDDKTDSKKNKGSKKGK